MPDYTACNNKSCRARRDCFRYMFARDERQSFTPFKPMMNGGAGEFCDSFIFVRKSDKLRPLEPNE